MSATAKPRRPRRAPRRKRSSLRDEVRRLAREVADLKAKFAAQHENADDIAVAMDARVEARAKGYIPFEQVRAELRA